MKILFLDIDGVLNADDFFYSQLNTYGRVLLLEQPHLVIQPELVERLQTFLDASGVEVVLSSNWRMRFGLETTEEALRYHGFTSRIVGTTPVLYPEKMSKHVLRGDEISAWLTENPTDNYTIIDDMDRWCFSAHLDKLVQIDPKTGITDADVDRLTQILGV